MNFESKDFTFKNSDETIVIAEVGVNHNGDPKIAKQMIDAAVRAGVHITKFQAFRSEKEISKYAMKAPYQKETTSSEGNQLEMCKALELSGPVLKEMKKYCAKLKMPFLCTAFDFDSVDLLVDELKVSTIKVPSGEVTNFPFLEYIGSKKKGVILSTGASNLSEVGLAIQTLIKSGCPELMLFHCVTSYPAPHDQVNLRAMMTLKNAFGLPVGFSDHTVGIQTAIAAAALGAVAIEKHFTLDRNMVGPDHRASIEPHELAVLVEGVRVANLSLGSPLKQPAPCELPNLHLIRKSLVASSNLKKGTCLTREMIEIKRPQGGIEPMDLNKILGLTLKIDIEEDQPIKWEDLV
jgi:N-acetylneuraminate synthase